MEQRETFAAFYRALEDRHAATLTFSELRRATQALSWLYVERRAGVGAGKVFEGRGKRAAFALVYGVLHFLLVRQVVRELGAASPGLERLVDLGCGTGVAGAAWALECAVPPRIVGVDFHPWALAEARWTYRVLGLQARTVRAPAERAPLPGRAAGVIAAFALNELPDRARELLRARLLRAAARGARVLVVEPIAKRLVPWWPSWEEAFRQAGGRADAWKFPVELPATLGRLRHAAGLERGELRARTLYVPGSLASRPLSRRAAESGAR